MRRRTASRLLGLLALVLAGAAPAAEFESGSIDLNRTIDSSSGNSAWQTVTLQATYTGPPVIIAGPVTHANDHSLSVRVRNVTATDFEIALTSPCDSADADPNAAGNACPPPSPGNSPPWNTETVRWLAVPPGVWQFPDGTLIEAGTESVSAVRSGIGSNNAGDGVSFQHAYSGRPIVLHTVNSASDESWITSSVFGPGNDTGSPPDAGGFTLALEGAEVTAAHGTETVGWVAIEPGDGTNNGNRYSAGVSAGLEVPRHDDGCLSQGAFAGFAGTPDVVAAANTVDGSNGMWLRYCGAGITSGGINVHVDEDQVGDAERTGLVEASSWFAFDPDGIGLLFAAGSVSPFFTRETFETYATGSVAGGNGGSGWGGAWTGQGGGIESVVDVAANPLAFTDSGDTIDGGDLALAFTGDSDTAATRDLAQSVSDPAVYASMLVRFEGTQNDNDFFALWFEDSGFGDAPNFGIKMNRGNGSGPEDFFARSVTNSEFAVDLVNGRTYFLVVRIRKTAASSYDRATLWVDPTSLGNGAPPPADAQTSVDASGVSAFDTIGFRRAEMESDDRVTIDELRIGTSWAEVTAPNVLPVQRGRLQIDTQSSPAFESVALAGFDRAPVVLATVSTDGSDGPAAARVDAVSASGFRVAPVEPPSDDGPHPPVEVDYVALGEVDAGEQKLYLVDTGEFAELRRHDTTRQQGRFVGGTGWDSLSLLARFSQPPAVLAAVQSMRNDGGNPPADPSVPWLETAVSAVGADDLLLALERAETSAGSVSAAETVGLAIFRDGSRGTLAGGIDYEALRSGDSIVGFNNGCSSTAFAGSFAAAPVVVANRNTRDGGDGGWMRRCALDAGSVGLLVDEDQDNDTERSHTTEVAAILAVSGVSGSGVDHYAVLDPGQGVTCEALPVTIEARDAADNPFTPPAGTTVDVFAVEPGTSNPAPTASWGGSGTDQTSHTFDGSTSAVTLQLRRTSEGAVNVDVDDGTASEDPAQDPDIAFLETGFLFYADGAPGALGTQIAAKPSNAAPGAQALELRAVEDPDGPSPAAACEARLSGSQDVDMAFECSDPATCSASAVAIDASPSAGFAGSDIPGNDAGSVSAYAAVTLDFGSDGRAPFALRYPDAGEIVLHARKDLPASGDEPAVTLSGAGNAFVSRPFGFHVTATGNPGASGGGGAGFVAAGVDFPVAAAAVGWAAADDADGDGVPDGYGNNDPGDNAALGDNPVLPNFGPESGNEAVTLGSRLWLPGGGNDAALAGATTIAESAFEDPGDVAAGAGSTSVRYLEVGIIELRAEVADGDYLGAGNVFGRSGPVGRFFPADFVQAVNDPGAFAHACSATFSYSGQDFGYDITPQLGITARNAVGTTTQNYTGTFARLEAGEVNRSAPAADGTTNGRDGAPLPATATLATGNLGDNGDGTFTYTFAGGDRFGYVRDDDARVDPFDSDLTVTIDSIVETDDNVTAASLSDVTPAATQIRFGRLVVDAASGSELAPIEQPVRAEYWLNGTWQANADDGCTALPLAAVVQLANDDDPDSPVTGDQPIDVAAGTTGLATLTADPVTLAGGSAVLGFSAPGDGNTGFVDTTLLLQLGPAHLQFDWDDDDGAGDGPHDDNPEGRVTFGIFGGDPNWIHFRRTE